MDRRLFMKSGFAASAIGMMGFNSRSSHAFAPPTFNDYKALICLFLHGGNDAWNTFIPIGASGNSSYGTYSDQRSSLAVANSPINFSFTGELEKGEGNPYYAKGDAKASYLKGYYPIDGISQVGVNALMPELAHLLRKKKASLVADVGTLVEPISNRAEYEAIIKGQVSKQIPLFLFAHNHQQRILQTGRADSLHATGWAGRIADLWDGLHAANGLGINVSLRDQKRMMIGRQTQPVILRPGSILSFAGMNDTSKAAHVNRRNLFQALTGEKPENRPFIKIYNDMLGRSIEISDLLLSNWEKKSDFSGVKGPYGEDLFAVPTSTDLGLDEDLDGDLITQLEAVAQLISIGSSSSAMNLKRQIFFVNYGTFDHHGDQTSEHPTKLRELSLSIWKIQKALQHLGVQDKVALFTLSDFGRTMSNNGDGTDHAWSTMNAIVSEAPSFGGGKMHGSLPDLRMGGDSDSGSKGRFIPKIAVEQVGASLCRWFGIQNSELSTIFPNLEKFKTGSGIETSYLQGLI